MNVLLVKPYNLSDHIQPSLGLGYLAQAVRHAHNVRILDCIKERVRGNGLLRHLDEFRPDVIGFQIYTQDLAHVRKDLVRVKQHAPGIITVAGGPHPSAVPQETFEHMGSSLDFIFLRESEKSFPLFLDRVAAQGGPHYQAPSTDRLEDIPGLCWMDGGTFHANETCVIDDLDSLGFPAWDLIRPQDYPEAQHGAFFRNFPIAPIMASRGCPFQCTFCAGHTITGKKMRRRSVPHVIEEIELLTTEFGIREIHIVDDNFALSKDFVMDFCRALKEARIHISWATPNGVRLDTLDAEMLAAMKDTGYYLASVGIEFASDRMLKATKKNLTKAQIVDRVNLIHDAGLDVAGFFMLGYPGETQDEIKETIRFACQLPLLRANFFLFLPLPGTEAYATMKRDLQLGKVDWERFRFTHPAYVYDGITARDLKNLQRRAFLRFYLRPRIFARNLSQIKSARQLKFLMKRAYRWVLAS